MIETAAYDNDHGQPVAVIITTGHHDVSRLVHLYTGGVNTVEQLEAGRRLRTQIRRRNGGTAALELLRTHGGPDLTADEPEPAPKPCQKCRETWCTDGDTTAFFTAGRTYVQVRLAADEGKMPIFHCLTVATIPTPADHAGARIAFGFADYRTRGWRKWVPAYCLQPTWDEGWTALDTTPADALAAPAANGADA